jgi:hypothetical protein
LIVNPPLSVATLISAADARQGEDAVVAVGEVSPAVQ